MELGFVREHEDANLVFKGRSWVWFIAALALWVCVCVRVDICYCFALKKLRLKWIGKKILNMLSLGSFDSRECHSSYPLLLHALKPCHFSCIILTTLFSFISLGWMHLFIWLMPCFILFYHLFLPLFLSPLFPFLSIFFEWWLLWFALLLGDCYGLYSCRTKSCLNLLSVWLHLLFSIKIILHSYLNPFIAFLVNVSISMLAMRDIYLHWWSNCDVCCVCVNKSHLHGWSLQDVCCVGIFY